MLYLRGLKYSMKFFKSLFVVVITLLGVNSFAQETLPVYSDYLSDNVYLVHPAAAGVGDCAKIRLTARNQWAGVENAPALQTLNGHGRITDNIGVGGIFFNDKNGYHSQMGVQATFAYHINFGRIEEVNQLSFGLSAMYVNNTVDESSFVIPDPVISQIVQSESYFNADVGFAYHYKGFFSYLTAKNLLLSARGLYNDVYEPLNLRRYLGTVGYFFGNERSIQFEPSVMGQYVERTKEKFVDLNLKVYKKISNAQLWAGFSYRMGLDNAITEDLTYLTPIIGVNINKFMVAYTYTKQSGDILFDEAGFHQISLGFDFGCRPPRRGGCPNINGSF